MPFLSYLQLAPLLLISGMAATSSAQTTSSLWGRQGEMWSPAGRLPDFSFAGYHCGQGVPPEYPPGRSVKEFGAVGDGITDDTDAFSRAIEAVEAGAIEVPPGRYRIERRLTLRRPGVVLRGAGPGVTTLVCPTPLQATDPDWGETTSGLKTSNYSWSGGMVTLSGRVSSRSLCRITLPAVRGSRQITVDDPKELKEGQWIFITQRDLKDNSFARHLYSDDPGSMDKLLGRLRTTFAVQIKEVTGNTLSLSRPLRHDLDKEWDPRVVEFKPTVFESGIEGLRFEFPNEPYKGHFTEVGWNAISMNDVVHCWARNIQILNGDSGIFLKGHFNTLQNIQVASERKVDRQQCIGHHGISVGGGDNLVTDFHFKCRYIHDLTVSSAAAGNVFMRGSGLDLAVDHHRRAPFENLFTELVAGAGTRFWKCGGGDALGKHSGARETFWNIRSENPIPYPPSSFGPWSMNLVGITTTDASSTDIHGKWFETMPPEKLFPQNLYQAQRDRRLQAP